jgi:type IV pilus assembly protein PilC
MSAPAPEYKFAWHGVSAEGVDQHGVVIASDTLSAQRILRSRKIVALRIVARGQARAARLRSQDVTQFSRQLASLLQAGLPLLPALELIARSHARAAVKRVVGALAREIARGVRFSAALESYPQSFGALYCQLVLLGEATGSLNVVLARLADDRERAAAQIAKLRAALTYPVCVLLLAIAITAGLMIFVVPAFKQIFDGVGAQLPAPTRVVLALSDWTSRLALPAAVCLVGTAYGLTWAMRRYSGLRLKLDRWLLRAPLAGVLLTHLAVARWSRALGTLLRAGTPLADAFEALTRATGNRVFDRATREIGARLRRGQRLATAMQACACFPAEVVQPIAVAEETGALDTMLTDLATLYERQADERIAALASLAEPLIIAILGLLVGALVVAMYLPIIEMGNVI